ncbi:hypothetical protein UlMin_008558 [Ulmus minor]
MRFSCNGCRILRRGCSESCPIRPSLQWIKSSQSQANATLFLAKFYGRAGLINLINGGPPHLRPVIFKSLLYEACGRIVNPVSSSTGLLLSGRWNLCEAAVDAVLKGAPIKPVSDELINCCDIRHVSKNGNSAACDRLRTVRSRRRFKRSAAKPDMKVGFAESETELATESTVGDSGRWIGFGLASRRVDSGEGDSNGSIGTVETSLARPIGVERTSVNDVDLELTLGFM